MMPRDLGRLLRPRSVAVIGGTEAGRVIDQLDLIGFDGEIWAVHPSRETLSGRHCHRTIGELPGSPDAAFLGVPREHAVTAAAQLAEADAGGIVVYASGFREAGNTELEASLVDAAAGVPLIGPNTYGYVNAFDNTCIWPDVHGLKPVESGVAIVTQSGNIGINLTMARRSLDIGIVATAGNQADVELSDWVEAFLDDRRVTAIGIQLESITDPVQLGKAAGRAASQGIPIVALKMGQTDRGSLITASHTGAMTGEREVYDAFLAHYGIGQVSSIPAFLERLKLIDIPDQPRLISLSSSGGEAAHVADLAALHHVDIPDLDPAHIERIATTVDAELVSISNPMDYHTLTWGDGEAQATSFDAIVDDDQFDVAMLVIDFPRGEIPQDWWTACEAFAKGLGSARGLVVASLSENMPEHAQTRLRELGLIPMVGIAETVEALGSLRAAQGERPISQPRHGGQGNRTLDEVASKAILKDAGIRIPNGEVVSDPIMGSVPYPRTVKVVGVNHKAEVGGVAVGLADSASVSAAITSMPASDLYLVEETVDGGGAEILVNIRATDLGWMLTLGIGGSNAEMIDQRRHLMLPTAPGVIDRALGELGLRVPGALVIEVVGLLAELVAAEPHILEVEINPALVRSDDVIALDAMVVTT